MGLTLLISGIKNVQQAYISRTMQFKRFFYATLGGTIVAAILGITLAYQGYGVWALVIQSLINSTIDTVVLWVTVKWRPKAIFSFSRLKGLLSYGWKMLMSSLLDTIYNNIRQLIIGVKYSAKDLAFYNKGKHFPDLVITNINTSIDSVLLPTMSKEQDNIAQVKKMTRRAIKMSTYIMAPIMMGLAFVGQPLIRLVLTDKWIPCVPYMCIFCITYMFFPVHTANLNAIKAMGRSDLFLKLEIIKKVIGIIALVSTMHFGVMAMTYSLIFTSVASQIINSWPNRKLLNYGYLEQLKDILPGILLAVFMGVCVSFVALLNFPDIVTLMIQVPTGAMIYIGLSKLFKLDSFEYLWQMLKSFKHK
jgi:O-antigen/teichoic acid export membrane protein